jgi:O-antigen/teichoic acid export membrane protein
MAAERQNWLLWVRGGLASANLLLDFALIPRFGAMGAACAILVIAVVEGLVLAFLAWRLWGAAPAPSTVAPFGAAALAAAAAALPLAVRPDAVGLVGSVLLAAPVYVGVLAAGRFFRADDAVIIGPLLQRVPFVSRRLAGHMLSGGA